MVKHGIALKIESLHKMFRTAVLILIIVIVNFPKTADAQFMSRCVFSGGITRAFLPMTLRWTYDGQYNHVSVTKTYHTQQQGVGFDFRYLINSNRYARLSTEFNRFELGDGRDVGYRKNNIFRSFLMAEGQQPYTRSLNLFVSAGLGYLHYKHSDISPYLVAFESPYPVSASWNGIAARAEAGIIYRPENAPVGAYFLIGFNRERLAFNSYDMGNFTDIEPTVTSKVNLGGISFSAGLVFMSVKKQQLESR